MNGILIVNKPIGKTSHDIVYKIKKLTGEKVGHTGTLDPLATGVLPVLIGKGTLCSKYLINHDKIYDVTLKLGIKTITGDGEGNVIEEKDVNKDLFKSDIIEKTLASFMGKQEQIPPIYSAIKVKGKKLYEYARKGQKVEIKPRQIEIYSIKLLNIDEKENEIRFQVKCSKGTYIRSLCEDIASKCQTVGYMKALNRIEVGDFNIKDALDMEELNIEKIEKKLITLEQFFNKCKKINLNEKNLKKFLNGAKINNSNQDGIYRIYCNDIFIGIGVIKNSLLKRDIIEE